MSEIIKQARKEAELSKRSAKLQALPGINISFTSTGLEAVSHLLNSLHWGWTHADSDFIAGRICECERPRSRQERQKAFSSLPKPTTPWRALRKGYVLGSRG
jgi:exopolyphosphatase/pppGpp-phosphohydrolase